MDHPDRRSFLRRLATSTSTALLGGAGCTRRWAGAPDSTTGHPASPALPVDGELRIAIEPESDPAVLRGLEILRDRIQRRTSVRVTPHSASPHLILALDRNLPREGFEIREVHPRNRPPALQIRGGSGPGLLYGIGKYLRTSRYEQGFAPSPWRGRAEPRGTLRGMYFAAHFHNWYHQASETEVARYLEDLALWGVNAVWTSFPAMNLQGWQDPAADAAVAMLRKHGRAARSLGLQFGTSVGNTWFSGTPDRLRAVPLPDPTGRRGNHGFPICPSSPEGHETILAHTARLLEQLRDPGIDFLVHWPYDEGGCACEVCRPWGHRGYLRLARDLTRLGRQHFPELQTVLSTWMFDTPPEGEWKGLSEALERGEDWLDFILADAHEDYPRYPLDTGVPGGRPLLNFPEISMWGNWPWGGVGANPLPDRFQRLWDQVKDTVRGGFPYSEGIYEDLNKAIVLQFYWDAEHAAQATVSEYAEYEFGTGTGVGVVELVQHLEHTASHSFRKQPVDLGRVRRASELAEELEARMPEWGRTGWRWEILRLRAVLDRERFLGEGLASPAAEKALRRLIEIYHAEIETDDPYHHRVRPPLRGAISRRGNH